MIILSYKKGHDLRCPRGCCFEGHVDSECLLVYRWPNEVAPYIVLTNQDEENEWVHLVFPDTATLEAHLKEGDIDADGQALQIFMDSEEDSNAMRGEVNRLQKEANVKREKERKAKEKRKRKKVEEEHRKNHEVYELATLEALQKKYPKATRR